MKFSNSKNIFIKVILILILILFIYLSFKLWNFYVENKYINECYNDNIDPYSLALSELNDSYCKNTDFNDLCHDEIIFIKSRLFLNKSYCNKLINTNLIDACKVNLRFLNIDFCDQFVDNNKSFCKMLVNNDLKECNNIKEKDLFDECRLFYYLSVSFNSGKNSCINLSDNLEYYSICTSIINYGNFSFKDNLRNSYCKNKFKKLK